MNSKMNKRQKSKYRIRKSVSGTAAQPRLAVFKSNKSIYCQLIDDINGLTLASVSSKGLKGSKIEQATEVGKKIGAAAVAIKIDKAVFDRSGYIYHGRIKSVADGAREAGLKI